MHGLHCISWSPKQWTLIYRWIVRQGTVSSTNMVIGECMAQQKCEHILEIQNTQQPSDLNLIKNVWGLLKDRVWESADEIELNDKILLIL
jgi:hypothetical protein